MHNPMFHCDPSTRMPSYQDGDRMIYDQYQKNRSDPYATPRDEKKTVLPEPPPWQRWTPKINPL